jgi:hypothetical protein
MLNHYLLSIPLASPPNSHLHGYLMCKDEDTVQRVTNKMLNTCEKDGCQMLMPVVLCTKLSSGVEFVRSIITEMPGVKDHLATAKDFHMTEWIMGDEDPRSERLLKLH